MYPIFMFQEELEQCVFCQSKYQIRFTQIYVDANIFFLLIHSIILTKPLLVVYKVVNTNYCDCG